MIKSISKLELKKLMDSKDKLKIIDVLGPESFDEFHLPNAINIPVNSNDFEKRVQVAIPARDHTIVVYCTNKACEASVRAAEILESLGYTDVYDYEAGKEGWKNAADTIRKVA